MNSTSDLDQILSEPPCDVCPAFAKLLIRAEVQTVCMESGADYSLLGEANDLIRWASQVVPSHFMGEQGKAQSFQNLSPLGNGS